MWMPVDRSEQPAVGIDNILVLRRLPDLCNDLTLNRDQVVLVPVGFAAVPERQLFPGRSLRGDGRQNVTVQYFAVRQGQDTVVCVGEASCVCIVARGFSNHPGARPPIQAGNT